MNIELEKKSIQRLKSFEPETEPYYLCYSGGKDSDTIRILAHLSGVKHDIVNNHTTVDAPETVRYIRSIPNVKIEYPNESMWELIVRHGLPPTRLMRYCCSELKERGGKFRVKITGVRWAESRNRLKNSGLIKIIGKPKTVQKYAVEIGADYSITKQGGLVMNDDNSESRRMVEHCYRTTSTMVNPIIDWSDDDVWDFLHYYGCDSNPLYQCGFNRIGCVGCPLGGRASMLREFSIYPKYRENYIRAFDRMLHSNLQRKYSWQTGYDVFKWWVSENPYQLTFFDVV